MTAKAWSAFEKKELCWTEPFKNPKLNSTMKCCRIGRGWRCHLGWFTLGGPTERTPLFISHGQGYGKDFPLLAHAIMQWDTTPTTVTLGQKLFQTFREDAHLGLGGFRVEGRVSQALAGAVHHLGQPPQAFRHLKVVYM